MVRGWLDRGVDGFRLDTFNVFLKHPDLPSNPTCEGSTAWSRARSTPTTSTSPTSRTWSGGSGRWWTRYPGTMSVGELFVGTTEGAAALTTDRHLVFDWELLTRPWSAARVRRRDRAPRAGLRSGPLADDRAVEPRPAAPRLAPHRFGRAFPDGSRRGGQGRGRVAADDARHAVPVLRRGDRRWATSPSLPTRASTRRRRRSAPTSRGGTDRRHARRCRGPTGRAVGSRSGRPWLRLAPDTRTRNVAAQAGGSRTRSSPATDGSSPPVAPSRRSRTARSIVEPRRRPRCPRLYAPRLRSGRPGPRRVRCRGGDRPGPVPRVVDWRPVVGTHRDLADGWRGRRAIALRGYEAVVARRSRAGESAACYHARGASRSSGRHHVPLEFLKKRGGAETPDDRRAGAGERRPGSRCPRRSSPRTTSSSCTTRARAAKASG